MASSNGSEMEDATPSQKRKRQLRDIEAELALFTPEELLKVDAFPVPNSKRPKQAEVDTQGLLPAITSSNATPSTVLNPSNMDVTQSEVEKREISLTASHADDAPAGSESLFEVDSDVHGAPHTLDESMLDSNVDMEAAAQYMGRIATTSGRAYSTHFSYPPFGAMSSSSSLGSLDTSLRESSGDLELYRVARVHHSKSAKEFERLVESLKLAKEMVVISYHTNGDSAKEFSSTRGCKDLPKNVMVPALNTKEQLQVMAIRIDAQEEIFELEMTPQTSNAFAIMQKASSGVVEAHYQLIRNIIKRKAISSSVALIIYNTQRLLRLLQFQQNSSANFGPKPTAVPKKTGAKVSSAKVPTTPATNTLSQTPWVAEFRSFEEPPLDPYVAGFVLNPEMGVEPDQERSALSMRSYEIEPMLKAYCPKLHRMRAKNLLADDTFYTRDLALNLFEMLRREDLLDAFVFEMRVAVILAQMETPGMLVDLASLDEPRKALEAKLKDLHSLAAQILGHDILLSSPAQVSSAIFSGLEDYVASGTKSKNSALRRTSADKHLSTKENALLELKKRMKSDGMTNLKQYKLVEIVLESRPIHKLQSFLEAVDLTAEKTKDPRYKIVYPRWLQCNTGTGRVTGASPNMQTQPTPDEIRLLALGEGEVPSGDAQLQLLSTTRFGSALETATQSSAQTSGALVPNTKIEKINIRASYVSREGYTLVGADYSQIEMRILAQVSNDEQLIHFFKTGMDIHRQVASRVFKITPEQVSSQQREWCKRIVYGIVYGMGVQALSKSLDISTARGKEFYESFMGSFPKVQQWIANTKAHIRASFKIHTMLGRIRKFQPGGGADAGKYLRQGVNTAIQGSAADIVKLAMVGIDTEIFESQVDAKLLLQIHDELIYEVKDSDIEPFKIIMRRCMEGAVPHFDVPLTINIETGHSWGLMTP